MYDSYKRRIDYLRISVTDRCNLRCTYCMPEEGVPLKSHADILSYEKIVQVAAAAAGLGIGKVRLTGGEPLLRRNITFLVRELKALPDIAEVSLTTNGTLLAPMAEELRRAGLDRLNVSLDTLDAGKYRQITRGGDIGSVLAGLRAAADAGFRGTKVNMVLIPGFNDREVEDMKEFCRRHGLLLQRIHHYSLHDHQTTGGLLEAERPLSCRVCNRLRLTADGKLKPCLFSDLEIAVDFGDLRASLKRAAQAKPAAGVSCRSRENWQIGG